MSTVQTNRIQHSTGTGNNIILSADGDTQVNSLNGGPLAGFRNQIINGLMLINNRDNNNLSNPGEFCPDRWYNTGSSILGLNKLTTAGLVGVGLAPVSGTGIVRQAIELPNPSNLGGNVAEVYSPFQPNSVWTLSLYSDNVTPGLSNDGLQYADGVAGGSPQDAATGAGWVSEGNGRWSNTYTFNSSSPTTDHNCLIVQLQWTAGRVGGVQLEPGHVATPFEHRPIGTELALCQRYYQVVRGGIRNDYRSDSTAAFGGPFNFLQTMRVAPTSTKVAESTRQNVTQETIAYIGTNGAMMRAVGIQTTGGISAQEWVADFGLNAEL